WPTRSCAPSPTAPRRPTCWWAATPPASSTSPPGPRRPGGRWPCATSRRCWPTPCPTRRSGGRERAPAVRDHPARADRRGYGRREAARPRRRRPGGRRAGGLRHLLPRPPRRPGRGDRAAAGRAPPRGGAGRRPARRGGAGVVSGHQLSGTTLRERTAAAVADERLRGNVARAVDRFASHRLRGLAELDDGQGGGPDALRRAARAVKADVLARLPDLLEQFADRVLDLGGHVCWAPTAADARR